MAKLNYTVKSSPTAKALYTITRFNSFWILLLCTFDPTSLTEEVQIIYINMCVCLCVECLIVLFILQLRILIE